MHTTVLGGGLSGLSAAYYMLRRFGQPVTLYEGSNRVGGWIKTERHNDKGFQFELGPRTIRPKGISGANTLELIEDLQLPVEAIFSNHHAARNRLIYAKGKLCLLPNSLKSLFKTIDPFTKPLANAVLKDIWTASKKIRFGDESIYDFTERRFGTEIATYAISPMICGICAGDAKDISVRFLMDDLFEKEQKWGGVTKGLLMSKFLGADKKSSDISGIFADKKPNLFYKAHREKWSMYRVQNGLDNLPRSLSNFLRDRDVNIELCSECREIKFTKTGIKMNIKGREENAQHIIASMPAHKLSPCVKDQHPSLAGSLLAIPYVDVAVISLQYNTRDLLDMKAFGFLVPPIEQRPILGVIFDSCCFDMENNTVLTVMMGGKWFQETFGTDPTQKELLDIALQQLEQILGLDHEPKLSRVNILKKCIPQYTVGHKRRVNDIREYIRYHKMPLSLCGAAYDGVGINDVILSARRQVDTLQSLL